MQCTYLHGKHATKKVQGAQKISDQDSINIDVPTEIF